MRLRELREPAFGRLAELMEAAAGVNLAAARRPLVASRLAPRLQRLGLDSYEAYVALIAGADGGAELRMAVDLLTTQEGRFFHESVPFDLLESELSRQRPPRLRLWSAATAFGDEAYSLAMLLADLQQAGRIGADWAILGTDVNERALRSAAEALYPVERLRLVTPERLRRHALGGGAGPVQMRAALRERVDFLRRDLRRAVDDLGPFDVILLHQVLGYFDAPTRRNVVEGVLDRLRPGGLFLTDATDLPGLKAWAPGGYRKP